MYVSVLGTPEFEAAWRSALPKDVFVVEIDAVLHSITKPARVPVVLLVDGTSPEAEERLEQLLDDLGNILVVVATNRTTPRLAQWSMSRDIVLLPPPCSFSTYLPVAACLVEKTLKLFQNEWRRRSPANHGGEEAISDMISLNQGGSSLLLSGTPLPLLKGELQTLLYLLENRRQWVKPSRISSEVFGRSDEAGTKLVWQYVSRLRAKLKGTDLAIDSSRMFGYRLSGLSFGTLPELAQARSESAAESAVQNSIATVAV